MGNHIRLRRSHRMCLRKFDVKMGDEDTVLSISKFLKDDAGITNTWGETFDYQISNIELIGLCHEILRRLERD